MAAEQQGGSSNSREHALLLKVLNVPASEAPGPEQLNLANLSQFLEQQVAAQTALEEGILLLARAWRRSEEGGVVPSTWPGIAPLQEAVLNVALSGMLAASAEEKLRALTALLEVPVPARLMNDLLVGAAEDDDEVPRRLLLALAGGLRGRHLNDLRTPQVAKLLRVLRASKRYPAALVAPPCLEEIWQPAFQARFQWKNRKQGQGVALQSKSLLGWLLAPSALDCSFVAPSAAAQGQAEAGTSEWQQLLGASSSGGSAVRRIPRQRIEQLQKGTQLKVMGAQGSAAEFADVMLRAGDAPRLAVLTWTGALLTSAEPRGKQGHVAPEGFNFWPQMGHHVVDVLLHQETPPFERSMKNLLLVQALQARIHGFPTSGMAVNSFNLLLHLAKPIKPEQAAGLCCYFPLRSDSAELLGSWQKEARFGEEEQVKAAEQQCASGNGSSLFAVPLGDKTLFKTEIFWLACKGLGVLLLPVAKETFQAFSNIASACHDKSERLQHGQDSDTAPGVSSADFAANADVAWREVLLAESMVKEPGFLEHLGHFVNLTFCFLLHNASPGDGSEPLPPAAPGPRWHALPSVLLENVLELCDLYRERHPPGRSAAGGGLPTGLYAHIDPKPLLTTLCIVMASDEHVKDPSLRGRAVKLLHRLCMAFQSWMEQLNQPPLGHHLIPCLVTVFIAVEKAILSYYDLAYRYKYELRLPVMDLFDLALSHPSGLHIKVLDDFSKSKQGTEKLGKLLTQLINDSNSQTDEAIKTVKEYRERQAKEMARAQEAGSGRHHDEEVLEDDHTEGGEDVYRRSRMNYKEHAKKYFGLASKTWKQLWLLCKHVAPLIVEGRTTVLEQLLHSSLDAQLHVLVGPEMKSIQSRTRGSQQEFEELGFEPNVLMKQIAEIYLFLTRVNMDKVVHIVGKDERYYSSTTFSKAFNFLRKYHLLGQEELKEFDGFVKDLAEKVTQQRAAFNEADIPEEFLCQMMADIMSDPVMFPQSKKVVDRSVAERQIMGADRDPYANTPLKVEELIPMPELKEKIHKFAKENGIVLEGGNMFD